MHVRVSVSLGVMHVPCCQAVSLCLRICMVTVSLVAMFARIVCACMSLCQCLPVGFCRCCCVCVTLYACVPVLPLSFVCLLQCVFVTGACGSVYVSDALGLPISVSVCHYVCPSMCHHLPRCHTMLLTAQATGGRVGPTGARAGPTPSHPPRPRPAACLQCLPQVNTKIRKPRATSLTSALPLSLPWTGLDQTAGGPELEMCPAPPPPLVTSLPEPQPWPRPICPSAPVCVPLWGSTGFPVPDPLTWVSLAVHFSTMTVSAFCHCLSSQWRLISLSPLGPASYSARSNSGSLSASLLSHFVSFSLSFCHCPSQSQALGVSL